MAQCAAITYQPFQTRYLFIRRDLYALEQYTVWTIIRVQLVDTAHSRYMTLRLGREPIGFFAASSNICARAEHSQLRKLQYLLLIPYSLCPLPSMSLECGEAGGSRLVLLALVTCHGGHWRVWRVSAKMKTLSPHIMIGHSHNVREYYAYAKVGRRYTRSEGNTWPKWSQTEYRQRC